MEIYWTSKKYIIDIWVEGLNGYNYMVKCVSGYFYFMFKIIELKYINSGVCREYVSFSKTLGETKESKKRKSECLHLGPWDLGELRIQLNLYEVESRFQVRLSCASPSPTPNDANEMTMGKTLANQMNPDEGRVLRICPALPWTWDTFD